MKYASAMFLTFVLLILTASAFAWSVPDTGDPTERTCNPQSYTDLGNGIVQDQVTGLMWQQATAPGTYTWDEAVAYCDSLALGGYDDWRLPTILELSTLVDSSAYNSAINETYFPSTYGSYYWSSTVSFYDATRAWYVYFYFGDVDDQSKTLASYVRAVRGVTLNDGSFTDNGNGTVSDAETGLMWQQSEAASYAWDAAKTYCENLTLGGYSDWRLPTRNELQTIIDYTRYNPAIDTTYFPFSSPDFWSSTTDTLTADTAWVLSISSGEVGGYMSTYSSAVRAVRGGPCESPATSTTTTTAAAPVEFDFTAEPMLCPPGAEVTFAASTVSGATGYAWKFGDGETGTGQNVTHTYSDADVYDVTLTVAREAGPALQKTKVRYVAVAGNAPAASFTAFPTDGAAPLAVTFTDTSTGDITGRTWQFGDGQTGDQATVVHTYRAAGQYTARLTVTGSLGSSTASQAIAVETGGSSRTVAGRITGAVQAGIEVSLTGEGIAASARTTDDGVYDFDGIAPGRYRITPLMAGYIFEPPGAQVRVGLADVLQDFTSAASGPIVTQAEATPDRVPADGATQVTLTVTVGHPEGAGAISSVTVDLRPIGGEAATAMVDNGTKGDAAAGDGVYTVVATVSVDTGPGLKPIPITATAGDGVSAAAYASFDVYTVQQGSLDKDGSQDYPIYNRVAGQTLRFVLTQTVGGAGSAGVDPGRQMVDCAPNMVVISPSDVESSSQDTDASQTTVEVPDAEAGQWTCTVANPCETTVGYELESSISGSGLVSGLVVDAATGTGLDGVSLSTTAGIGRDSEQGVFVMVHPAGSYSLSAGMVGYMTARKTLTVSAGGSAEMNIALSAGSDSTGCLLQSALGEGARLERLRRFRDRVLAQTAAGRLMIRLYDRLSPWAAGVIEEHPFLKANVKAVCDRLLR